MSGLENLNKTWFVDIDGTLFVHRSNEELDEMIEKHEMESHLQEAPIQEAIDFINNLPKKDRVLLTTARESRHLPHTLRALYHHEDRFDQIIDGLGSGPRIVVNDIKPKGSANNKYPLATAYAINVTRNLGNLEVVYDDIEENIRIELGNNKEASLV